jgi:DNA primase
MSLFETIREQILMADVVGAFTKLKHSSSRLQKGRCPLPGHSDTSPSFFIYPDGHAHCYGCGFHGDLVDFWAAVRGLPPGLEAALDMAREYSIVLPDCDPETQRKADERREKEAAYVRQAEAYHQALPSHPNVVAYLEERGFNEELRKRFLLGTNRDGSAVVIPFWHRGRIQGLILRQLQGEPKYLLPKVEDFSSGHRPLFIPGSTRGDLHFVEGYFDAMVIAAMDLSAVAPGGTGISPQQQAELDKLTGTIYIFPDADKQGTKAAREWVINLYSRAAMPR